MVGLDTIAEEGYDPRAPDLLDRLGPETHIVEVGRILHIGRILVPAIEATLWYGETAPVLVAVIDTRVLLLEHLRTDRLTDRLLDLLLRGPDILQVDRLTRLVRHDRLLVEVDIHRTREGIGDD